jgi:uncharacterized protein
MDETTERVVVATRRWIEKAVIGLRLCPFAAVPFARKQIRYRVSQQRGASGLAGELEEELVHLHGADPEVCETSLLIHPHALNDFADYNQFLDTADATIAALELRGVLQIASFHPNYQFAGSAPDDVENCSNRSPYPMLHLLREASVTRAVQGYAGIGDIGDIGERNLTTLRALGHAGWLALLAAITRPSNAGTPVAELGSPPQS